MREKNRPIPDRGSTDPSRRIFVWVRTILAIAAVAVFGLILFLTEVESGIRAYIHGEGLWSKGQKSALTALTQYALTHDDAEYERFESAIRIPLGDRLARTELQKPNPDYDLVRQGFIAGGNHPDDVERMTKLFRRFHGFPYMREAIAIWTRADRDIERLAEEGRVLRVRTKSGLMNASSISATFRRLQILDDRLTPLELTFSETLGEGSRVLTRVQIATVALESLILLALALVTSRRRVNALHFLLGKIHEREARFDAFMRNIPAVAFIKDEAGGLTWTNNRFQEIVELQEGTGSGDVSFSHTDGDERSTHASVLERNEPVEVIGAMTGSGGSERSWLMIKFPIDEGSGRRLVGSIAVDVTRIRQLENELERATRVSSLGTLATTVAHEFNNVLMAILPFAQYLRKVISGSEQQTKAADSIIKAVDRGRHITRQILTFGHPVAPALQNIRLDTWLAEFADTTKDIMRAGVRIELRLSGAPVSIEVDPGQLHQALVNLATNANDAMPRGGTITIEVHQHSTAPLPGMPASDQPYVEIVFRDTGQGMPREVLDHIFEPLFTTKRGGGTGLGLAVVHQVVAGHKGHVSVDTKVGEGTAFHLFLPQRKRTAELHAGEPAPATDSSDAEGMRILLVEDDATVAMALTSLLEMVGASVEHVSEGAGVPAALQRSEFDLVVLDVSLGDIDGIEVYRRLRTGYPDLPVLFSTGHATEATVVSVGPDPHTGWLLKPYDTAEFLKAVRLVTGPPEGEGVAILR